MLKLFYLTIVLVLFHWSKVNYSEHRTLHLTPTTFIRDTMIKWKGEEYTVLSVSPQKLDFFLENKNEIKFKSFSNLSHFLNKSNKRLLFAMNGGMYLPNKDNEPQGLYIESGNIRTQLDSLTDYRPIKTNFYLHPNGVFYITKNGSAHIKSNKNFQIEFDKSRLKEITFATQSGPLLVQNNTLHKAFTPKSKNIHIRNAVGILPNGDVCLVISKTKICFHDIASLFKEKLKCRNALYLDGFVSRLYYPKLHEYNNLNEGNFGVIIGIVD